MGKADDVFRKQAEGADEGEQAEAPTEKLPTRGEMVEMIITRAEKAVDLAKTALPMRKSKPEIEYSNGVFWRGINEDLFRFTTADGTEIYIEDRYGRPVRVVTYRRTGGDDEWTYGVSWGSAYRAGEKGEPSASTDVMEKSDGELKLFDITGFREDSDITKEKTDLASYTIEQLERRITEIVEAHQAERSAA